MGKTIIQQARGHGSMRYRVKRSAYSIKPKYPARLDEEYQIIKLVDTGGHSAPIAKMKSKKGEIFFNLAANGLYEGQIIKMNSQEPGSVVTIGGLANGTEIFNLENSYQDGGQLVRTGGNSATVSAQTAKGVKVMLPSKQEKEFDGKCRATLGVIAGTGRLEKPILKAGKQFYIKGAKSKLWPRTSAIKFNAIDHPFGGGRGKRIKSKIAKRNAPPGAKVGLLRPRRTGRKKK